jgi:chemotaxis-related protein WspB
MLMLLFNIGEDQYSLSCEYIVEVFPTIKLKRIPHVPDFIPGLMNYGGIPVPVIDVARLIENRPCTQALHTRIILLNHAPLGESSNFIGLMCEKVTAMRDLDKSLFMDVGVKLKDLPFLGGIYTMDGHTIQFFNDVDLANFLKGILNK